MKIKISALMGILTLLLSLFAGTVTAAPVFVSDADDDPIPAPRNDNRPDPLTTKQSALKQRALEARLNGKATDSAYEVERGEWVELERESEGVLWTVLGEFIDLHHNGIPEPDRSVDNTTIWVPDFNRDYFMNLLFNEEDGANSMRNFYIEQSSNRYTVHGDVTDWIEVPGEAATYDDDFESELGGNQVWYFLKDSVNGWYDAQIAAGKTSQEINEYLSQFDVWDRYDYDEDGIFDEPDGYIDTFQSVHAGIGNESCSPKCDDWAIWSHSWYAFFGDIGDTGPAFNLMGGIQIGDSNYWVGKYTIQPENGGVGVFVHEYGHDLGLPDLYDYYGENGTGFWTLMSSGSWLDDGLDTIGNKSSHMGAWEKFQLGWLKYEVAHTGEKSTYWLGPMEFNTDLLQGLLVELPEKTMVAEIGTPYDGSYFYYSGMGNDIDHSMTKSFTLPEGPVSFTAMVNYTIELDWDYAYLMVNGEPIETNLSTTTDPNGQNFGYGITGTSDGWVELTADISAYAGTTVDLGFRYWTDGAVVEAGFMVDEINITGFTTDGAEDEVGWEFDGFIRTTGTEEKVYQHYYVLEYRTYQGYDNTLKVGPYYFGYPAGSRLENWVDHFPYQDGLLINYWDTAQTDNNTANHPGQGLLLPIDAHYQALYRVPGVVWRNRIQTYDSTFTIAPTDSINFHYRGKLITIPSLPGASIFDDSILHYDPANPLGSVIHPNTGTQIEILKIGSHGSSMKIEIRPAE